MKYQEIVDHLVTKGHFDIEFTKNVELLEGYDEPNMRATVTSITSRDNDGLYRIIISRVKFDEFNKMFESRNYYDSFGKAKLTAREAGFYSLDDNLYLGGLEDAPFKPLKVEPVLTGVDYIEWRAGLNAKIAVLKSHFGKYDEETHGEPDDFRIKGKIEGIALAMEELDRYFRERSND